MCRGGRYPTSLIPLEPTEASRQDRAHSLEPVIPRISVSNLHLVSANRPRLFLDRLPCEPREKLLRSEEMHPLTLLRRKRFGEKLPELLETLLLQRHDGHVPEPCRK